MNDLITIKIDELKKRAPKGWVILAAAAMKKKPNTIYSYAVGSRGHIGMIHRLELKSILQNIVDAHEASVKKLLS
jgi:hypothetical protein